MPFITELTAGLEGITSETRFAIDLSAIRQKNSRVIDAEIETYGANVAFKFGYDSNVAAVYSFDGTTKLLPAGNYHCTKGTVKTVTIPSAVTYISVCPKSSGTASVFINFGFERA